MSFKIVEGRLLMVQSIIRDYGPRLQNDINALMSKTYIIIIIMRLIHCVVYSVTRLSIVINITIIIIIIIFIDINIITIVYAYIWFPTGPYGLLLVRLGYRKLPICTQVVFLLLVYSNFNFWNF